MKKWKNLLPIRRRWGRWKGGGRGLNIVCLSIWNKYNDKFVTSKQWCFIIIKNKSHSSLKKKKSIINTQNKYKENIERQTLGNFHIPME